MNALGVCTSNPQPDVDKVKEIAQQENVPLIDLHARSTVPQSQQ